MDGVLRLGRLFFALSMVFFGVEYFIYVAGLKGPIPGPPWLPGLHPLAVLTGAALIAVGVCIVTGKMARLAAALLGIALLLTVVSLHLPGLFAKIHDPGPWTSSFELLALMGGAFVLAWIAASDGLKLEPPDKILSQLATFGHVIFAASLVVFAVQHFLYAKFIATLIPAWIPARLFWSYFVGVAFLAAALAIVTAVFAIAAKKMAHTASILLGVMFLLWVVILHLPRVAASPRNGNEATSLLVALAMGGASFILAESSAPDSVA